MSEALDQALAAAPQDQAAGLRRLFAGSRVRFVPVAANPHVAFGGVLLERLCSACNDLGLATLMVDATDGAVPHELTRLELAAGIETWSPRTFYLAAEGLAARHVDATGSTARFLDAVADAAPQADVVLVHAGPAELARLFARRQVRPLLLADDRPASVTHAYACLKLLALRGGLVTHDLLLAAAPQSPRAERIAPHLARCADDFLGALVCGSAVVDPAVDALSPVHPELRRFVRELLLSNEPGAPRIEEPRPPRRPVLAPEIETHALPRPAAMAWAS